MSDQLIIETPEQITLEMPLAGVGSRFLAVALDTLFQAGAFTIFMIALGLLANAGSQPAQVKTSSAAWTEAVMIVIFFLLQFGYFAFFEAIWNGQTPGKRILRLRVVKSSGQSINAFDALLRNLLRIVDSLPGIYVVGIISALLSAQSKRLGDHAAGTVVVREQRDADRDRTIEQRPPTASASAAAMPDATRLTEEEFQLIEAFLVRRGQLAAGVRHQIAWQITERIAGRLALPKETIRRPEEFLETLAAAYREQPRYL